MNLRVLNPYDRSLVWESAYDTPGELERKLAAATAAAERWRDVELDERVTRVRSALDAFRHASEDIAREVTQQMGKPIAEARGELATMLDRAETMLDLARESLRPDVFADRPGFVRRIEHVPLGVVLNIAAWNYPLLIPVNVVVPALAAGNSVLLKHSARTPMVGDRFERAFVDLGIDGLVQNVIATHDDTSRLVADDRIGYVAFTGSVPGGRSVYRTIGSERLIDVGLELGGKDPAYVAADANLDFAAAGVVEGATYNAGQSCCAVERAYIHESVYDEFLDLASAHLSSLRTGDPLDETTTLGPLASDAAPQFLTDQVDDALRRGAREVLGGGWSPGGGNFFRPTLLDGVPNDASAMQEESFGPLLPVAKVMSDEEALARMTDTRFGLTASVWTEDGERAERLAASLDVGTVFQNRCDYLDPALPWTGVRESGKGSTLSRYGYYHLTRRKSIHFRRTTD